MIFFTRAFIFAEIDKIELLMCSCSENCLNWTLTEPKQGVCFREKLISEAEYRSRNTCR